jgi:O-antigen ligase
MNFLLIPILFVCVTMILNEPLNLARSALLISWALILVILKPQNLKITSKWQLLVAGVPLLYIFSAIINKQNPILALIGNYNRNFGLLTLIAVAILVITLTNEKPQIKSFINWGLLPTAILAVTYSFVQSNGLDPVTWYETTRTVLTLGNSNYSAALLGVLVVLPIYGFLNTRSKLLRTLLVVPLLLLIRSGTNTGAFQFIVLALLIIVVFLVLHYWPVIQKISSVIRYLIVGILTSFLGFVVINYRSELIAQTNFADRFSQQTMALRMFSDHPIFGVGVDQLYRYMPLYFTSEDIQRVGSLSIPDKTHNLVIDHFAMGGILVGLIYFAFLIHSLVLIYRINKAGPEVNNRSDFALIASIWITYVVHLFISTDNLFMMAFGYISFGLISQLYYSKFTPKKLEGKTPRRNKTFNLNLVRVSAVVVLVAASVVNVKAVVTDAKLKKIVTNQVSSSNEILLTLRSFPNPIAARDVIAKVFAGNQNCPLVIEASNDLLRIDDRSSHAWYFKALCSDAINDQVTALKYINTALEYFPLNLIYLDAKVRLEFYLTKFDAAKASLNKIKEIDPAYESIPKLEQLLAGKKIN